MRLALVPAAFASLALTLSACGGGGDGPSGPPTIAFSAAPPTSMSVGATATVSALVANDPAGGGVTWSVSCAGSSDCGSISPASTANGSPAVYTAPATLPNPASVTLTASARSNAAVQVASQIAIVPAAAPALADGTYVFHLDGQDASGPYHVAGAFTVTQGRITGGEQDFSDADAGYTDSLVTATSTLSVVGGNLQIVLDTGNNLLGVDGLETLRGNAVSADRVLLSQFDVSGNATGSLDRQGTVATPAAGWAFSMSGSDGDGDPFALGGVIAFQGGTLATASSVFDASAFTGTASRALLGQGFASGSVSAPDAFGRVVVTLTPSASSGAPAMAFAGYVVDATRMQLVESAEDGDALNTNLGGSALGQGSATGTFTDASVLGHSYAHMSTGGDVDGSLVLAGAFGFGDANTLSGTLVLADHLANGVWTLGGSYNVAATGRVTVQIDTFNSSTKPSPAASMSFVLYFDGSGRAMVLGTDGVQTSQGIAFSQDGTSPPSSGSYALAAQGEVISGGGYTDWNAVGRLAISAGIVQGSSDLNDGSAPRSAVPLTGVQDTSAGLLHLTGLEPLDATMQNGFGYYPMSGNRLIGVEVDGQGLALLLLEGVSR